MKKVIWILLTLLPLVLIFYGCWLIHPPTAFIVLGAIIWVDINIGDGEKDKR